jgi:glycosyltransferase involved in cell wall biosynthesis
MIIGIDGNEANVDKKVGIGEYAFELLTQFKNIQCSRSDRDPEWKLPSGQMSNIKCQIYLKDFPLSDLPKESEDWRYRVFGPGNLWTQWRLPLDLYLHKPRPDVFFSTSHYAPRFSPVPSVISIMDLSYLHFPKMFKKFDLYQLMNWTKYSARKASAIITISNSSRNDIMKTYGIRKDRIGVVYPGIKPVFDLKPHIFAMNELKNRYKISEKYILFVGTLQPRKNIVRLIESFSKIVGHPELVSGSQKMPKQVRHDIDLVIVGKKGWMYEEILAAPEKYGITDRVKFLDFVPQEHLQLLYKNALCFVFPSLYEGFGLPILEAMKYDCPVITSNVSSMPEAGGDAALYVDPLDVNDISNKLNKLIDNEKLRQELIDKGRKQVKKFSWEKAARETLEVLTEVTRHK